MISVDLAGSEKNRTGIATPEQITSAYTDKEILKLVEPHRIVGIDAPLSLPSKRKSLEHNNGIHFRECDLKLRELGIRFFPLTLGPMRVLTERGIKLKNKMKGKRIIELFPGASYDMAEIKRKNIKDLIRFSKGIGISLKPKNQDEADALMGLITLVMWRKGFASFLSGGDGKILILNLCGYSRDDVELRAEMFKRKMGFKTVKILKYRSIWVSTFR